MLLDETRDKELTEVGGGTEPSRRAPPTLDGRPFRVSHRCVAGWRRLRWGVVGALGAGCLGASLSFGAACSSGATLDPGFVAPEHAPQPVMTALPPLRDAGQPAAEEATRIIAASRAAYAACRTYDDTGTYETLVRTGPEYRENIDFRTAFAGPHALRLAYRESATQWRPARVTQLIADASGVWLKDPWDSRPRNARSLATVYGLAGVSRGIAPSIVPLLPSGVPWSDWYSHWSDLRNLRVTGNGEADGTPCDILEAVDQQGMLHVQLWIARSDSLLRRKVVDYVQTAAERARRKAEEAHAVLRVVRVPRADWSDADIAEYRAAEERLYSSFSTTNYHPRCNEPIAPEALRATDGGL